MVIVLKLVVWWGEGREVAREQISFNCYSREEDKRGSQRRPGV